MINKRIFIGGIDNAKSAAQLDPIRVDTFAICLSTLRHNPWIPVMSRTEATSARSKLSGAKSCFCLTTDVPLEQQLTEAQAYNPQYYLVDIRDPWPNDSIATLRQQGQQLILSGFTLDYDDDASAVAESMKEQVSLWAPRLFQLTLTPSRNSPLQWFRDEAGEFEEDATLADLQRLVDTFPILLNAVVDDTGGSWFEERLPGLVGWFFWSGLENEEARTPVTLEWDALTELLRSDRPESRP